MRPPMIRPDAPYSAQDYHRNSLGHGQGSHVGGQLQQRTHQPTRNGGKGAPDAHAYMEIRLTLIPCKAAASAS